ncbi:immunity 22 family protein [Salmonella enterica]
MMSDQHDKVHLWLGTNFQPESEYKKYFELDYSVEGDFDDPAYKLCQFCRDIGTKWYDEDFIGIIPRKDSEIDLDTILDDAAVDESEKKTIIEECKKKGLNRANAIFWYADSQLKLSEPIKDSYNGLKYIGLFEGD